MKRLEGKTIVDNVDLSIEEGRLVAILGPNGSGKSTLLQLLAGVLRPDKGRVEISGVPVTDPRARRVLAYLPQEDPLYPHLTGRENIRVLAWMRGCRVDWEIVEKLADELKLASHLDRRVGSYSGGMMRKLSIIAMVAQNPRVAILDEPTSGLDPASRLKVLSVLRSLAEQGTTILYTTHIGSDAEHADTVLFMLEGRIVARGSPRELVSRYVPGLVATLALADTEGFRSEALQAGFKVEIVEGRVVAHVHDESELADLAKLAARHGLKTLEARRPGLEDAYLVATGVPLSGVTRG